MRDIPTWIRTTAMMISIGSLFAIAVGVADAQRGPQPGGGGGQGAAPEAGQRDMAEMHISQLAANLGVSEDVLRQAMAQTREEMRPIVEEQLGPMQAPRGQMRPMDQGMGQRMGMHPDHMGRDASPRFAPGEGHMMPNVASFLQMQPEQLREQLASGRTLADIARGQGVNPDTLADQIASAFVHEHESHIRSMIRESMEHPFGPRSGADSR